jgi:hypothetical protein
MTNNINSQIEEILDTFHNKLSALETERDPRNEPDVDSVFDKAKADLLRIMEELIGEDEKPRWNGDFCDECEAFLEDDKYRCYCDIRNSDKTEMRSKLRGGE